MDTKRLLRALLIVIGLSLLVAACAPPAAPVATEAPAASEEAAEEPAEEVVTLRWVEWWDAEYGEDTMDELIARFEAENPDIKVERVEQPWGSMYDSILTSAQAETATYDVLGMEACCWLSALVKQGALEPVGPYLEQDPEFAEGLVPQAPVTWLGDVYMLNWYVMPYAYAYNVGALEEAGLEPPTNWDEMVEVTKALNESDAIEFGLGGAFNGPVEAMYYNFGSRLAQLGGRLYDENNCAVFNSPEGVQAMEDWKALFQGGLLAPGAIGSKENDLVDFMKAGRIAAMFNGPWVRSKVRLDNPDIEVAFAPAWTDAQTGSGGYQWAGSGLAISSNSQHKDEAWRFIKFLLSDETSKWMAEQESVGYATQAAFDAFADSGDPILERYPNMMNQDPEHNLFLDPTVDFSVHNDFVAGFQDVLQGNREAQEVLDEVVKLWNAELEQCQ